MKNLLLQLAGPAGRAAAWLLDNAPGLLAVLLISAGAWLIYPPAGLITAGALLLADRVADRYPPRRDQPGGDDR
ncbi:hypothetical protein [Kitasatospora sp. NPDC057500]|uniref:hypothetical protein n=1 Tax=Kitasatospora sp. NPDC057500 TaxID=3346151 RepID=UPI00368E0ED7